MGARRPGSRLLQRLRRRLQRADIWHPLETGKNKQEVSLKDLAGTDPVLLTFSGDGQWTEDALGRPATLAYDWTYKMTIQRVDESGNAL